MRTELTSVRVGLLLVAEFVRRKAGLGTARRCAVMALAFVSPACSFRRGVLAPAAPEAREIDGLFWVFFWTSWFVFSLVAGFTVVACICRWRRQRRDPSSGALARDAVVERKLKRAVTASTATSVVILIALLVASVASGRTLWELDARPPLRTEVTGHRWWWEIRYPSENTDDTFTTASELHVPVGSTVQIVLRSADVIHSFWMPQLTGKRDLIPSQTNTVAFRVEQPGVYWGRCAEFCGAEHARMDLPVVAESRADFERWRQAQRAPAAEPHDDAARAGRAVFLRSACPICHTVAGTGALASVGPNLTHFASRTVTAGGAVDRAGDGLGRWIARPDLLKPGAQMPPNLVAPADMTPLIAYLRSLE